MATDLRATDLRATEIYLELVNDHVDRALAAACAGLKEFLFTESRFRDANARVSGPNGDFAPKDVLAEPDSIDRYASVLEHALTAAGFNVVVAGHLSAEARAALYEIKNGTADGGVAHHAFERTAELQKRICALPAEREERKDEESRAKLRRGTAKAGIALAAAAGVGALAIPAAAAAAPVAAGALAWAAVSAVLNLALGHVFGKSVDAAYAEFKGLPASKAKCCCHCDESKHKAASDSERGR